MLTAFYQYLVNYTFLEINECKSEYYQEYKRDYFIPESGYLIFD